MVVTAAGVVVGAITEALEVIVEEGFGETRGVPMCANWTAVLLSLDRVVVRVVGLTRGVPRGAAVARKTKDRREKRSWEIATIALKEKRGGECAVEGEE